MANYLANQPENQPFYLANAVKKIHIQSVKVKLFIYGNNAEKPYFSSISRICN